MKNFILITCLATSLLVALNPASAAEIKKDGITGKTVLAGVLSLLIWPGIGQAVNDQPGKKVTSHAIVGILPPFRFWSGYDALVDRNGGYWEGKI